MNSMAKPALSHVDGGRVRMVDVGHKRVTEREATAAGAVRFSEAAVLDVLAHAAPKGNVLETARLAGIMGAKRTAELIPLCHPLTVDHVDVECVADTALPGVRITATVRTHGRTGVEMEALIAVSVAALTIIDMMKSADRWMRVESVELRRKRGGRSGSLQRPL